MSLKGFAKGALVIGTSAFVNAGYAPLIVDNYIGKYIPLKNGHENTFFHNFADTPHALTYVALAAGTAAAFLYAWNAVRDQMRQ